MQTLRLSNLNVRVAGGIDREGGGSGPLVVLMHGYGAPGDDLVALQRVLDVPREVRFAFPEAPLAPPDLALYGGRAWWQIDVAAWQRAAVMGHAREIISSEPIGMPEARASADAMLTELERTLDVPAGQLLLGGFSQGAMVALDVALHSARPLAGLVLLSATLVNVGAWQPRMAARAGLPVLQTHGREDPLLSYEIALELRDLLSAAGMKVEWHEFRGGHELPQQVLTALGRFIRSMC